MMSSEDPEQIVACPDDGARCEPVCESSRFQNQDIEEITYRMNYRCPDCERYFAYDDRTEDLELVDI